MKHRQAPKPVGYKTRLSEKLKHDRQVIRWTQRLLGDPEARPTDLDEDQLAFVQLEILKRREDLSAQAGDLYVKAMHDTCPILAAPELERDKLPEDLRLIWAQPEMQELWKGWDGPPANSGPAPDYMTAKALMAGMGMTGISAHADDIYSEVTGNQKVWSIFEDLDGGQADPLSYQAALRQFPKLAIGGRVFKANIEMVKEIARLNPGGGVGERLMIDGMGFAAWCKQAPKGTPKQEAYRRRHCPEAGFRAYIHTHRNKEKVGPNSKQTVGTFIRAGKAWRGYYLVVIADQATGLPLVWMVIDASWDEAACIVPLLRDLYEYWPDCPAKVIIGDSAWDEDPWCRLAELDYGIHPVFRIHNEPRFPDVAGYSRDGSVKAINPAGQLVCRAHGLPLKFVGTEHGGRVGLYPGQSAKEGEFRVRGKCSKGCGTLGLKMDADWSRLTHYPHHNQGPTAMKRYSERQAYLTGLNGMEGIFQRLQNGKNLGTKGAARTRIRDKDAHEALMSLALLSMTAAAVADQRHLHGIDPELDPAKPAPRRPRRPNGGRPKARKRGAPHKAAPKQGSSSQRRSASAGANNGSMSAGATGRSGTAIDGEAVFRF